MTATRENRCEAAVELGREGQFGAEGTREEFWVEMRWSAGSRSRRISRRTIFL